MIEKALIQADDDGLMTNASTFAAFLGFKARGRETLKLSRAHIEEIEARPEVLVFGDVGFVRDYLARLGCAPTPLDYPSRLRPFMGRRVEIETLGVLRRRYNEPGPPVFIKPVKHKLFNGQTVQRLRDLVGTLDLDADTLVYCVEVVEFLSEWRVYCRGGRAVGMSHYKGDPLLLIDPGVVERALAAFSSYADSPCTCALDFGYVPDGRTLLVEVNDMISLGSYGLDPRLYSMMIEERWDQLMEGHLGPKSSC